MGPQDWLALVLIAAVGVFTGLWLGGGVLGAFFLSGICTLLAYCALLEMARRRETDKPKR